MRKLTQKYVENYCLEHGYRVMSLYVNAQTKIKLQNIETGETREMKFNSFQQGHRFDNPNAALKPKLTYEEYLRPFIKEGYQVNITEEEYKNINSKIKIKVLCPSGHEWSVNKDNFTKHRRCPMCNQETGGMSHGERLIYSILSGNGIDFKREVSIYINGELHKFDFYLELNNKKYFIEYDGEQHFKESKGYLMGKLSEQQRKDGIKDQYALNNNIHMVRISYTKNTISKVVKVMNNKMGLDLHEVKVYAPKKQEILDYYLNHNPKETVDRFMIDFTTICKYAKDIWGTNKEKYLVKIGKKAGQKEVADYYLYHSLKQTMKKFGSSKTLVLRYFKLTYAMSKEDYLIHIGKKVSSKEIADYYLNHNHKETANKFGIGYTVIYRYFKNEYGMNKKGYLKTLDK